MKKRYWIGAATALAASSVAAKLFLRPLDVEWDTNRDLVFNSDYSRFTPARLVRNLTRGDYHALAGGRMPAGRAMVSLRVEPSGLATNCRVRRSSGDPYVDAGLCPLITSRLRFLPALDDHGRPIAYQLDYVATWTL